ncbi:peptidoglycan D,D-transpeptidase FtsI family protein [Pseudoxanthomonas dokdonensis]|uniref:Peptidoglycan D,D-transpeptidase FtsI n=1 Tax=Pseudoxanthomonas dokdonensis TaxID=344882 RepID=A0A0R0CKQ4_9GAMM|nr:penicillin-binding transpeptidase domain-containing protein [Pseudoxanthomonas dokdonensis]KRG69942.1 cell division protein [Pseudoxanthomonas dokdonensis]
MNTRSNPIKNRNRARFNLRGRLALVLGALGLCSVTLVGRAAYVQLIDKDFYQRQGDARFLREIPIPTSRGMITDRNGEPVAVSSPVESVWGNPQELLKYPERLPELAKLLGVPVDHLTNRLSQRADKEFLYLKRRINPDEARAILDHKIPGVFSQREFRRFYPQGEAMAHILGFTNIDDRGQEGLELTFDEWLRGKPGAKKVIRDNRGRIVENVDLVRSAQPGKDLTLSIDRRIQFLAYRELKNAMVVNGAASASIVVLDVATGEVLAMANLPTFNPNAANLGKPDAHRNRAVTDVVEPGSTMKPLTVATALKAGVVTPDTVINTSPGYLGLGKYTIRDHRNYGALTVTGIITKSSNIGSVKISEKLPNDYFYESIRSFGYGRAPGSGFPGESSGVLMPPARWNGLQKATMAYGYGLSATPLQIAQAYAALGNNGLLIPPTFVKGQLNEGQQVVSPDIAHEVVRMMETVTRPGGTATQAAILGYNVAGKTGTARQASGGGYSRRYISLFAGLVPAEHPRFATVVVINDPQNSIYGGAVAAPVFHNVMEGALRLMDVPPDDIETWLAAQAAADRKHAASQPAHAPAKVPAQPQPAALPEPIDEGDDEETVAVSRPVNISAPRLAVKQ